MKITIDLSEDTEKQLLIVMKDAAWDSSIPDFCIFLLRNAIRQLIALRAMRDKYKVSPESGFKESSDDTEA